MSVTENHGSFSLFRPGIGADGYSVDRFIRRSQSYFFEFGPARIQRFDAAGNSTIFPGTPIESISIAERSKSTVDPTADLFLMVSLPGHPILVVGDGLKQVSSIAKELKPLLSEFQCEDRPDALIPQMLRSEEGVSHIYGNLSLSSGPVDVWTTLELTVQSMYLSRMIDVKGLPPDTLPALCGIVAVFSAGQASLSVFGDGDVEGVDHLGFVQSLAPQENIQLDHLSRLKIAKIAENIFEQSGTLPTLSEVRATQEYQRWRVQMYQKKLNQPGGVKIINGQGLLRHPDLIQQSRVDLRGYQSLFFSSDGRRLGLIPSKRPSSLQSLHAAFPASHSTLAWMNERFCNQSHLFSEEFRLTPDGQHLTAPDQINKHDDIVVVEVGLNTAENTELKLLAQSVLGLQQVWWE